MFGFFDVFFDVLFNLCQSSFYFCTLVTGTFLSNSKTRVDLVRS